MSLEHARQINNSVIHSLDENHVLPLINTIFAASVFELNLRFGGKEQDERLCEGLVIWFLLFPPYPLTISSSST